MSADNVIYVKQEGEKWVVWHDFASNHWPKPSKKDNRYDTRQEALCAAHDMHDEYGFVEYGVCQLGAELR